MDDQLISFLQKRIVQLRELEALANAIGKIASPADLGDQYRHLIARVKEAWEETDKMAEHNERLFVQNPEMRKEPVVGWFDSVHSALMAAATHSRPPVNSRNLPKIHNAAYFIMSDLSMCRFDLEEALKRATGAGTGVKSS